MRGLTDLSNSNPPNNDSGCTIRHPPIPHIFIHSLHLSFSLFHNLLLLPPIHKLSMAPKNDLTTKKLLNRGAWTPEEDKKLAQCIEIYGAKRWKSIAVKSGLNRCGKSCRLRWLNYLRPNIKRGNISEEEEDLILRLHKLLGNRWSLIAGRLPGRTDNEIKNYWNSHLCKKVNQNEEKPETSTAQENNVTLHDTWESAPLEIEHADETENKEISFDVNEFFDFSVEGTYGLDWVNQYLELEHDPEPSEKS